MWCEPPIVSREAGDDDLIHQRLKKLVEKRTKDYLWVPEDAITFVPRLLSTVYGDGRALYTLSTLNQRPAYWIIRGDSDWTSGMDYPGVYYHELPPEGLHDFGDYTDEILTDLEDCFGSGRCGYNGSSLFHAKKYRTCTCEECSDRWIARWPTVDGDGGCAWGRMDWPDEFDTVKNPFYRGRILRAPTLPVPQHVWEGEGGRP